MSKFVFGVVAASLLVVVSACNRPEPVEVVDTVTQEPTYEGKLK